MEGIALSQRYFTRAALPILRARFPRLVDRCAAGLCAGGLDAGCGSEVYGYDDLLSRDHNWGPRFFLFLNEEDYDRRAGDLRAALEKELPRSFEGLEIRATTAQATHFHVTTPRRNAMAALDVDELPADDPQWFFIPEARLCEYAAGSIYYDPIGMMGEWKRRFASYPPNVLYKRLAGAFLMTHAAGNALRCAKRREWTACRSYLDLAIASAQRAALLLRGRYPPHVKWRARAFRELPGLPDGWAAAMDRPATSRPAIDFPAMDVDPATLRDELRAVLTPLADVANASGLIEPQPAVVDDPFLPFNSYGFSRAFEDKVRGELAGRPLAVALDQMTEGYMPLSARAVRAHWTEGRPGIARSYA